MDINIYIDLYFHCLINHVLCYVHFVTKVYYIESWQYFAARGITNTSLFLSRQILSFCTHYENLQPTRSTCLYITYVKEVSKKEFYRMTVESKSHEQSLSSNRCWWELVSGTCYLWKIVYYLSCFFSMLYNFHESLCIYNLFLCIQNAGLSFYMFSMKGKHL